uniref:Joining chain of multimeric IgA and IgM n=2 Tax=Sus scrofa TaxID=9823 RepID=F1RUQ0_PIG
MLPELQFFKRSEVKMKNSLLFWGVLVIFVEAVFVTAQDEEESTVLVDNKCKCARITSRIIRSAEDPSQDIVERNIRIIVPLNNRENISDPTSPLRTNFVYHLSDLCKKCDLTEVELDNQIVTATQSNLCDDDIETCYAYDRNKCYTNTVPFTYDGQTKMAAQLLILKGSPFPFR